MKAIRWCLVFGCALVFSSCSSTQDQLDNWMKSGSIAIARPIPASQDLSGTLLGFMPRNTQTASRSSTVISSEDARVRALKQSYWLSVNRSQKAITLMQGEKTLETLKGEGIEQLSAGNFELAHKQRAALWYAPDSYFLARGKAVPGPGEKSRFRRGALGEFSLFVNKDVPLHSGPIWTEEIGGVRLPEVELAKLYYSLEPGSLVEIK